MSSSLKGFSQVLLINNAITGVIILIGITIHSPLLGLIAFLSAIVGTLTGTYIGGDKAKIQEGIYSFNAILTGIAVMLFLTDDFRWISALLFAAGSSVVMFLLSKPCTKWKIPILTVPFVGVTWIGLLISYNIKAMHINPNFVTSSPAQWNLPIEGRPTLIIGLIKGIGEVFIIDSIWAGSFILVGLFVAGWKFGVYAIIGTLVSWITAFFIGADIQSLNLGLYNYNAVLTIIAVSIVLNNHTKTSPILGILAAALTVPVTAGLELLLVPMGLPALTFPFIVCSWLFLGARAFFRNSKRA
ncbi:urea transporter [Sporosarcina sp. G11-34]|uniref:urea transporter n=1 Tax=Sporosarcina sp. G11-34 TaxID=2849605 RepID=UPI0022A9CA0F|nr:urea transporter [Sporosarcina sp. G11-34]